MKTSNGSVIQWQKLPDSAARVGAGNIINIINKLLCHGFWFGRFSKAMAAFGARKAQRKLGTEVFLAVFLCLSFPFNCRADGDFIVGDNYYYSTGLFSEWTHEPPQLSSPQAICDYWGQRFDSQNYTTKLSQIAPGRWLCDAFDTGGNEVQGTEIRTACADHSIANFSYNELLPIYGHTISGPAFDERNGMCFCGRGGHDVRFDRKIQYCRMQTYSLIQPLDIPTPKFCAGNPIEVGNGKKIQYEDPDFTVLTLQRTYANTNAVTMPWRHNFQKTIRVVDPAYITFPKSSPYESKAQACTTGWLELKGQSPEPWMADTVSQLNGERCDIIKNGAVIRHFPIANSTELQGGVVPGAILLQRADGSAITFAYYGGSDWGSNTGDQGQLQRVSAVNWRFNASDGTTEDYDAQGKLISTLAPDGQTQTLSYDTAGNLAAVKNNRGHQLTFGYTGNLLTKVTLDNSQTTSYNYSAAGLMNKVTRPDASTRFYHYEDPRFPKALTGITDERGIRYASWTYDAQGRAISSEHAGGAEKTTLAFNTNGSTTVTNVLGKKTTYMFADILGAKRVTQVTGEPTASCVGANQNYTYTSDGFIESKTDWKGNISKFSYDSQGRELTRTDAFGTPDATTVQTCWSTVINQPSRIITATNITQFSYFPSGRLQNQIITPRPASVIACDTVL